MATSTTNQHLQQLEKKIDIHMVQSTTSDERMNRIEEKLDQLADAVISIARAEEKIAILMQDTKDIKYTLNHTTNRIHTIELAHMNNTADVKTLNKFFWLIATTTITTAATAVAVSLGLI